MVDGRPGEERWAARGRVNLALYAIMALTTTSKGALELTFPLGLDATGLSSAPVGATVSLLALGALASRLPAGAWYRTRLTRVLLVGGSVAHGLSIAALGVSDAWAWQAVLAAIHGFSFGVATTFILAALVEWQPPEKNVAPTIAWFGAANATGYSIGAPLAAQAIEWFGFSGSFFIAGSIGLGAALVSLLVPPAPIERAAGGRKAPAASGGVFRRGWKVVGGLPSTIWLATLLGFYLNASKDAQDTFFPIFAVAAGIPLATIGLLRTANGVAAMSIRFTIAGFLKIVSANVVNHVAIGALALASFGLAFLHDELSLVVIFVVLGIGRGAIRVTTSTAIAEERKRAGAQVGLASGLYNAGLDLGALLGPPIAGTLAAAFGITTMFGIMAVVLPTLYYAFYFGQRLRPRRAVAAGS